MHIPWGWIKQRPHFIAEGLSERMDVKVVMARSFLQKNLLRNQTDIELIKLYRFPFERFNLIRSINRVFYRLQLKKYLKDIDTIWFTSPMFIPWFSETDLKGKTIVYDCMDDFLEFPQIKQNKKKLSFYSKNEKILVQKASILITSASYLKSKLVSRYGRENSIVVINNAIKEINCPKTDIVLPTSLNYYTNSTSFKLVYIGTISSWMDFSLLKEIVNNFCDLEIFLFGPIEINLPQIERMYYCGKIEHDLIFRIMDIADVLIMPFVINELIKSVNPVKLYEYIYSGKPSLAPLYTESLPFKEYVYLYQDNQDCIDKLGQIYSFREVKPNIMRCREFCKNNTWTYRLREIYSLLN